MPGLLLSRVGCDMVQNELNAHRACEICDGLVASANGAFPVRTASESALCGTTERTGQARTP